MDLSFGNNKIKKICNNDREAQKKYGKPMAKKLRVRLDNFKAASNLGLFQRGAHGRCHELNGSLDGCLSVDLVGLLRLIFKPVGDYKVKGDKSLDWSSVTSIEIKSIEDTHENDRK